MKDWTQYVKATIDLFTRIMTAVSIATALYIGIFWGIDENIKLYLLWQMLGVSAICSLGTPLMLWHEEHYPSKTAAFWRNVVQFLYVNGVVLGSGFLFRWFLLSSLPMILGMEICIIAVYVFVVSLSYFLDCRQAREMNRRLEQRKKDH